MTVFLEIRWHRELKSQSYHYLVGNYGKITGFLFLERWIKYIDIPDGYVEAITKG
jgi:hypothetical protein